MASAQTWLESNRAVLQDGLARIRGLLQRHAAGPGAAVPTATPPPAEPARVDTGLGLVGHLFGLTPFEVDVLLLCAGAEVDGSIPALCGAAAGDAGRTQPTFGLALAVLPDGHWSALTPDAPLRRWRLVVPGREVPLTRAPLRIDERVLHFIVGLDVPDPLLAGFVRRAAAVGVLPARHERLAQQVADTWVRGEPVELRGADHEAVIAVANRAAGLGGSGLRVMHAEAVPGEPAERAALAVAVDRDGLLGGGPLLLDTAGSEPATAASVARWLQDLTGPAAVVGGSGVPGAVVVDVGPLPSAEQAALWHEVLDADADAVDVARVVGQFQLGIGEIRSAAARARSTGTPLWTVARAAARPRLDRLAQLLDTGVGWADLVVPAAQRDLLAHLLAHVRQRARVFEEWGFGSRSSAGVSALFEGASGTGKTLGAQVLASALDLDLYRVDLSQVVSKYIGETEKNLGQVFDAADQGGAVLLFDEADALFGRRSEVRDSHDRYANIEVSYLLQRMESYRGLAVLTTNHKNNLDPAFLRRLSVVVHFPFPDAEQRRLIWERVLPATVPTVGLRPDLLARLAVPGGVIRNVALGAAVLAADAGEPVDMAFLLQAARRELAKLERPLTDTEIEGWT
ncbi:ATP-binding protein [Pseudonocardia broussonetiae]|uniref:ATP-binding protein n=1 Tax=Pseudonocardia broussonetiae TaxID=2736640 RepID=A0A6M6JIQ5_9PSEU|nr:ATP-binding protein [Pseudonocardia broussonetiae]QJY47954.1 ATP-binding protein [Pseudonocardia broussonetiae]